LKTTKEELERLHALACEAGQEFYTDPDTGFRVMTRVAHLKRGSCCGGRCRHCPFNHEGVERIRKLRERTSKN